MAITIATTATQVSVFGGITFTTTGTNAGTYLWGGQTNISDSSPGLTANLYQWKTIPNSGWYLVSGRGADTASAREGAVAFTDSTGTTYMWGGWTGTFADTSSLTTWTTSAGPYFTKDLFTWDNMNLCWINPSTATGATAREGAVAFTVTGSINPGTYMWGGYSDDPSSATDHNSDTDSNDPDNVYYPQTGVQYDLYKWDPISKNWIADAYGNGNLKYGLTGASIFTIAVGSSVDGVYLWGGVKVCGAGDTGVCSTANLMGSKAVPQNIVYKWESSNKVWNYYSGFLGNSTQGTKAYGCSPSPVGLVTSGFGNQYRVQMYYGRYGTGAGNDQLYDPTYDPIQSGFQNISIPCSGTCP